MRATLISTLLLGAGFSIAVAAAPNRAELALSARFRAPLSNPCLHEMEGHLDLLEDATRTSITSTTSTSAGWRSEFGLSLWPRDSVRATTDSVVCTHLDSLLSAWMSTPAAVAENINRGPHWPGISVVRANPHRYLVAPPAVSGGWQWKFVIDSVSGQVQFYKTPF